MTALLEFLTALLEYLTALLKYLDLLQFPFQSFNVFFTEVVASVASIVATPLLTILFYH